MRNYTTSYSKKKTMKLARPGGASRRRASRRGNGLGQLPSAQRRTRKRRGASYLRHSQGFGASKYSNGGSPASRMRVALIVVGCAAVVFLGSVVWYLNRDVQITLNGTETSVRIGSSIEQIISDQGLDKLLSPGDLLAVDDQVLTQDGGEAYDVKLNGKRVKDSKLSQVTIEGGEKLKIASGRDTYESHEVQSTTIAPTITVEGSGPVQYVKTWGQAGRSEVWVGDESGKTKDRGVVKEAVNCVIECASPSPSEGNVVALTFNCTPSAATQKILKVLKKKGVTATFFMTGEDCAANAAIARQIADDGHQLGSLGQNTNKAFTEMEGDTLRSQLSQGFTQLSQATGTSTAMLRASEDGYSTENWAQTVDMVSAMVSWDVDSDDSQLGSASDVADTVSSAVSSGSIILMTDNSDTAAKSAKYVGAVIDILKEQGYSFATVSQLVKSDKELSKQIGSVQKVEMPANAVLPQYVSEDSTDNASE